MKRTLALACTALSLLSASLAHAEVSVKEPWVRATVASQKATGAFMQISSTEPVRLVEVRSAAAKIVEVHEMKMEGDRMVMQAVNALDINPGTALELKPGGYHVMLIDLAKPVQAGDKVALTLVLEDKNKKRSTVEVSADARALGAAKPAMQHNH
ncbi:MAG: hypothetical protein RJA44_2645 [Pseudomonadota bacterium]|jgi:copper(I)-binding protein